MWGTHRLLQFWLKALVGLRPVVFVPRTLGRTWGNRHPLVPLGLWRRGYSQQGLGYADSGAERAAQRTGYFANSAGTFAATRRDLADA